MKQVTAPEFNWSSPAIIRKDPAAAHAVLPVERDVEEDSIYDKL
jgi:hypothetical protein